MASNVNSQIVMDGIVYYFDPANDECTNQSEYLTGWVGDELLEGTGNTIGFERSGSDSNTYPKFLTQNGGTIGCDSFSRSMYTIYQRINLGSPVTGKTKFGVTDSYTVDIWFKHGSQTSYNYYYNGASLLGNYNRDITNTDYDNRHENYPFRFGIGWLGWPDTGTYTLYGGCCDELRVSGSIIRSFTASVTTGIPAAEKLDYHQWYNFSVVFDLGDSLGGGAKLYGYLNGKLKESSAVTTTGSGHGFNNTSNLMICGRENISYWGNDDLLWKNSGKGCVGPLKIYNKALTAAEAKQNYDAMRNRFT